MRRRAARLFPIRINMIALGFTRVGYRCNVIRVSRPTAIAGSQEKHSTPAAVDDYPLTPIIRDLSPIWAELPHPGRTRVKMPANS